MATVSNSAAIVFTRASALDHLSNDGLGRVPRFGRVAAGASGFSVSAKLKNKGKGKRKNKYPWPDNVDPNSEGGVLLTHLSKFKPLKERQKPVTLEFEKPLVEIEKKITEVRKMARETGLDFADQIMSLQHKYQQALTDLYKHLTPIQRVNIARHPNRPTFLDHIFNITDKFVELHGDRAGYDDPAIITGIGTIDGQRYMFIGHQKGRNTKENIERNFGMPTPHGYRKALRMMEYADHHGFPIVTFVDTPGAYADLKSEYLGQGEAIAHNLRSMFGLKVPIVSIVIGEGGSGGALAIACANKLLMLENAVFYVASPEACAAILWKSAKASPKAAEKLKITAMELCKLQIADGIIPEPLGGAHSDPSWASQQIKVAIKESIHELKKMGPEELLNHRYDKFRKLSGVGEGIPLDPIKKVNMKMRDKPILGKTPGAELAAEVEKLREQIQKAKESSSNSPALDLNEMVDKLKREVDLEFSEAIKAIGLNDRLVSLRSEFSGVANSQDQPMHPSLLDKIEKLKDDINQGLTTAPNYASLKSKLDMLKELSKAKKVSEISDKAATLKQVINQKFKEIRDRPNIKEKLESLKAEIGSSGIPKVADLPDELKGKILSIKQEIESEVADAVKSMGLAVEIVKSKVKDLSKQTSVPDLKHKTEELDKELNDKIEDVISSSDLKNMVELLILEIAKAGEFPDSASKTRIEVLEKKIKQSLADALNFSELKEKHKKLVAEVATTIEGSGESGTSLENGTSERENKYDEPIVNFSGNNRFA